MSWPMACAVHTRDVIRRFRAAVLERATAFSDREAGDWLSGDDMVPDIEDGVTLCGALDYTNTLLPFRCTLDAAHDGGHIATGAHGQLLSAWARTADDVVDAEIHCEGCQCPSYCGCGREMYSERERPGGYLLWFHTDDDTPIRAECRPTDSVPASAESPAGSASPADPAGQPSTPDTTDLNGDPEFEQALSACEVQKLKRQLKFARGAFSYHTGRELHIPDVPCCTKHP